MANETKIRNGLIIEGTLVNDEADRILVIDPTTGLVGYRAAIDLSTLLTTTLGQYEVIVGDSGGEAATVNTNSVGDVLVDETNGLTIKANTIVNADVNAAAAIAYSKLNLTGGIINADISSSAAIAYSKLNLATSIVNADVAVAAAIARTKIASGTAYRILANNGSGVMSENAAITPSRAVVADTNGQLVAQADGTTAVEVGYLFGVTGPIQAQLDDLIATQTVNAIIKSPTATEDGYAITWDDGAGEYTLTDPVTQGIPTGGTTRQWLGKNSGTNYDASWLDLVLDDITDISALAADLNLLAGADAAGITATEIGHINGVTSNIQTQLNNKLSSSLAANALFVGSGGNVAIPLAAGTEGYVLSISGGTPAWISPTAFSAEAAQDAVGGILDDGTLGEIVFTYDDSGGTISATMENAAVIGKVLTGFSSGAGTVAATDTILQAIQKLDGNDINGLTTNRIPYATSSTTLGDDDSLKWNATTNHLSLTTDDLGLRGYASVHNFYIGVSGGIPATAPTGIDNFSFIGLQSLTSGDGNIAIGNLALQTITTESGNVALGFQAGNQIAGAHNLLFGYQAGYNSTAGDNNIVLGRLLDVQSLTGSNQLTIQNAIFGEGNSGSGSTMSSGVVKHYSTSSIGSWAKATFLGNVGTESTAIADGIVLYGKDSSDGSTNSTLAMYLEQAVEAIGTFTPSHKLKIWINGVEYWIQLDAV